MLPLRLTDLGETRKINQCQAQDVGRIDLEVDGLPVDALVATRDPTGFVFNLPFDFLKVVPSSARNVVELCPLVLSCYAGWSMRYMDFVIFWPVLVAGDVDELENQRSSCDNAASSG